MTFGAPLGPVAIAEQTMRAALGRKLVDERKISRADADKNAAIWTAIVEWANARDGETWAAPACGWPDATREATRVAALALRAWSDEDAASQLRAQGLCKLAGTIAVAADVWTAPIGAVAGDEFANAYLEAIAGANTPQNEAQAA